MAAQMNPNLPPPPTLQTQQEWISQQVDAIHTSEQKMERAGSTMERMDHKDSLYLHLASLAMTGRSEITGRTGRTDRSIRRLAAMGIGDPDRVIEAPRSRTIPEKLMERRIDRRRVEKERSDKRRSNVTGALGLNTSRTKGVGTAAARRVRELGVALDTNMSTQEKKRERIRIAGTPMAFESGRERRTREDQRSANRDLRRAGSQPILSRWRTLRRNRAIDRIQESHADAEERRRVLKTMGVNLPPYQP